MRNSIGNTKSALSPSSASPFAVVALLLALVLAACGSSGDEIDAGSAGDDESTQDDSSTTPEDDVDDGATGDYQVTSASPDLVSAQPAAIEEIRAIDDQTIGVRYQNGSEPCSLANVTVTESDADIQVALETGLHPNAAAMSCIAQVLGYEIQVSLDAPIADRSVVAAEA